MIVVLVLLYTQFVLFPAYCSTPVEEFCVSRYKDAPESLAVCRNQTIRHHFEPRAVEFCIARYVTPETEFTCIKNLADSQWQPEVWNFCERNHAYADEQRACFISTRNRHLTTAQFHECQQQRWPRPIQECISRY